MTTGGTAFVNPADASGLKHSLRSATKARAEEQLEEAALIREEEKLIDEEITSEEEDEDVGGGTSEKKVFTVTLVNGVVESRPILENPDNKSCNDSDSSKRYGLRKRRRPAGQDRERLEHFQSSAEGGLARKSKPPQESEPTKSIMKDIQDPFSISEKSQPKQSVKPISSSTGVPNPLSAAYDDPDNGEQVVPFDVAAKSDLGVGPSSGVPCPLPAAESVDKSKKVTINEQIPIRIRGFSIDMDLSLDFPDDVGSSNADLPPLGGGRDRAFSFECFAFGINADEPLPPLEHPGSFMLSDTSGRPRGDSIIFDPSSFQEGGIHEQNALEQATPSTNAPVKEEATTKHSQAVTPAPLTISSNPAPHSGSGSISTSASAVAASEAATPTASSISFDLLNKDGRIGIYLPEARRARIARFHAKRTKRIWRKRIKYDCRKKLADSRPRIKGRFVKRSDMEE